VSPRHSSPFPNSPKSGHWSGLYGGRPGQTAVAMHASIIDHYMRGAYYPEGGGQMPPARLIQVIEAHGGEVRTLAPVREITVRDRRAEGVVLEDGTVIAAPLVISNADYARTVTGLVDRSQWDPANDHLCPPGHTNFQVMTLAPAGYDYWGVSQGPSGPSERGQGPSGPSERGQGGPAAGGSYRRSDAYRARKQALTDHLLTAAEQVLGPFRDHIVHVEAATPLSQERYTRSTGGTSYGYVHSPEQSGENRPQHRTELDGLWVVGANTASGHGIAGTMVGGVNCAGQILDRPLLIEMIMGQRLVEPEVVPPDPPGFDPMEWSRGALLRERRAVGRAARAEAAGR